MMQQLLAFMKLDNHYNFGAKELYNACFQASFLL